MNFIMVALFLSVVSCGYDHTALPVDAQSAGLSEGGTGGVAPAGVGFAEVKAQVFQPYCLQCHSAAGGNRAGINLETYANVRGLLVRISDAVTSSFMPPRESLPVANKNLLLSWIKAGAPEVASSTPTDPGQTPPTDPGHNPPTNPPPVEPCEDDDDRIQSFNQRFLIINGDILFDRENQSFIQRRGRGGDDGCDDDLHNANHN